MKRMLIAAAAPVCALTACSSTSTTGSTSFHANLAPTLVPVGTAVEAPGLGSMTVTKAQCGLRSIPHAAPRNADGTAGVVHPAAGNQFCVISATYTNTGSKAQPPAPFSNLTAADGQTHAEDPSLATKAPVYALDHPATSRFERAVAPGQSTLYRAYFQIPATTRASSIAWPGTSSHPAGTVVLG